MSWRIVGIVVGVVLSLSGAACLTLGIVTGTTLAGRQDFIGGFFVWGAFFGAGLLVAGYFAMTRAGCSTRDTRVFLGIVLLIVTALLISAATN